MVNIKNMSEITVVLNVFKRLHNLQKQIDALNSQTIKPNKILIWKNKSEQDLPSKILSQALVAQNNYNYGVWARFAFALNANTKYICIFDDDTIPGKKWFQNCLTTMENCEGLLGTRGLRFKSKYRYSPNDGFGWDNPSSEIKRVDIVGHSWFFKREWLTAFWRELPSIDRSHIAGEDIHFSYTLQKYFGLNTFVPPHPNDDKEMWGSIPNYAISMGNDNEGISSKDDSIIRFNNALKFYTDKGFKLCFEDEINFKKELIIGPGLSSLPFLKKFLKKYSWLNLLSRKINNKLKKSGIYL
tara:strand:- start:9389 stop:10285 length:897 start_codon:yes stop_codon:yes gene_type:complete